MDAEKVMNDLSKELTNTLKAMAKAKTPEEKLQYSQIVKNLCDSLGVFFGVISDMVPYDFDDEGVPF